MNEAKKSVVMSIRKLVSDGILCSCVLFAAIPTSSLAQSAESELSVVRSESVKISNIDDWVIGVFSPTDTINTSQYNWDYQCVYASTGSFKIDVTSQNGGAQLKLVSDSGDEMIYYLYTYVRRGNGYSLDGHTTPVFSMNNLSGSQSLTCVDEALAQSNLFFAPLVTPNNFNQAPPGIYRDVVTIVVSPE